MKTKIIIVVHQGCVEAVYSNELTGITEGRPVTGGTDVEVIDLDGDYREEGQKTVEGVENNPAFTQVWP